ncbi:hypothetical protein BDV25DRAFT_168241 [Aspergillus avenaceus]|uniref:Zn(2)-C6 fungal-type domain-containing protein n=1 Tax=Aspergillus avenaceus TaxID=36643 RepID=A0A5N6TQV0_ASPAV|nr:hypothetical protein BDV25DRAFT_168241 [Aspergillus avenaceus]
MSAPNDNYAIHKVSLKRTRQACGPCRRKKARCPGEKPVCSLCQRLGQRCGYGPQAPQNRTGRSRSSPTIAQEQEPNEPVASNGNRMELSSAERFARIEDRLDKMASIMQSSLPPDFLKSEVETYLTHFHDQPYCVFTKDWLLNQESALPLEIAFPLVALTSRLSRRSPSPVGSGGPPTKYYAGKAWDILSQQYRTGKLGLSFLQGTFLMALVDFADGQSPRGYTSIAIGLRTIQSAGLNKDKYISSLTSAETAERRRITWAYFMLDRSYNASRDYSLCLSDKHFTILFPAPDTPPSIRIEERQMCGTLHDGPGKQGEKVDQGILACLLRLYSIWGKATEYVFAPFDKTALPPWQTGSAMAALESDWMQFETRFADTHRYINVEFTRRAREEPQSRSYLSTWMCVQFLFHSIHCLLHHPFVMMVKLRKMDGNIPATFLQKSYESSLIHSRWIARFIREMAESDFHLYDPFIGYLCAIAATIQLEHTASKTPQIAQMGSADFRTLVDYLTDLSTHWENMGVLVTRVNELASRQKNYKSLYYNQDGYSGALSRMPTPSNIPRMSAADEALMWDILDFGSSSTSTEPVELAPSQDHVMMSTSHFPEHFLNPVTPGQGRQSSLASLPQMMSPMGPEQGSLGLDPMAEWSFSTRNGDGLDAALPELPDWMVFGGYVSEQL